jgi:protein LTV1
LFANVLVAYGTRSISHQQQQQQQQSTRRHYFFQKAMGRKKTVPFIDKKKSSTFHLLHRSQRDVSEHIFYNNDGSDGGEQGEQGEHVGNVVSTSSSSGMVLWPSPHNSAETNRAVLLSDRNNNSNNSNKDSRGGELPSDAAAAAAATAAANNINTSTSNNTNNRMTEWRLKLQQAGLLEKEEERAEKYVKEISGRGIFLHANGRVVSTAAAAAGHAAAGTVNVEDTDVLELNKTLLDNIPLTEAIDEDIQALLFSDNVDFDEYEDLNDEFILDAAQEPKDEDDDDGDASAAAAAAFDYDAHIQKLMNKARRERDLGAASSLGGGGGGGGDTHAAGASDQAFFSRLQPLHERQDDNDEDDDSFANIPDHDDHDDDQYSRSQLQFLENMDTTAMGVVPALSPDEERALCEKFAQTLAEYDDDDDDDDSDDDDEYDDDETAAGHGGGRGGRGGLPLEGNPLVEAALDEFLIQHQHLDQEDNLMLPKAAAAADDSMKKKTGGSGFSALMGKQMVRDCPWTSNSVSSENPALDIGNNEEQSVQQVLALATSRLAEPIVKPPAEEILIDGKSYFSERHRNPWDCESILSTYSNLDNNPVMIDASSSNHRRGRQRQQKNKKAVLEQPEEEEEGQIRLSSKTGLPLGVFSSSQQRNHGNHDGYSDDGDDDNGADTMVSVNKGLARSKLESTAEKKARKAAIKCERHVARLQKKVTRQVFQTELAKRTGTDVSSRTAHDTTAGKSVFRYS